MIFCPKCDQECETYDDDQRFDAEGPMGPQTYGSIYTLSECCDEVIDESGDDYGWDDGGDFEDSRDVDFYESETKF